MKKNIKDPLIYTVFGSLWFSIAMFSENEYVNTILAPIGIVLEIIGAILRSFSLSSSRYYLLVVC